MFEKFMNTKKNLDRKQIDMNFKTKNYLSNGRMVSIETIWLNNYKLESSSKSQAGRQTDR
jgi:hypothetical protein